MNPNIIEIKDHSSIVEGETTVRLVPGLVPHRMVLRQEGNKFITHREYMRVDVETREVDGRTYDFVVLSHQAFDSGVYFDFGFNGVTETQARVAAHANFVARCSRR